MLKVGPLTANVDVHIRYTLEPEGRATSVIRALDLMIQIPGLLKVAEPLVVYVFRKENVRICADTRGAETLRRTATEARRSHDYRHARSALSCSVYNPNAATRLQAGLRQQ
jgi:hypothetical protein